MWLCCYPAGEHLQEQPKVKGECTHSIRSTDVTPTCQNQSPRKSRHQGCPVQTLPPTINHVPGHGARTPVCEHEGGRRHWLRERVGPAVSMVGLGGRQGMQTDFRHGSNFLCAPAPPQQAFKANSQQEGHEIFLPEAGPVSQSRLSKRSQYFLHSGYTWIISGEGLA